MRVIKDGEGTVLQRFDYYPFGSESRVWTAGTNTPQSALRYRFGGKEIAGQKVSVSTGAPAAAAGCPYLDFGARVYDPRTAAWLSQDPLSEKYYSISPYVYCAGNPVNLVDRSGLWAYYYSYDGVLKQSGEKGSFDILFVMNEDGEYSYDNSLVLKDKQINDTLISIYKDLKNNKDFVNILKKYNPDILDTIDESINDLSNNPYIDDEVTINLYLTSSILNKNIIRYEIIFKSLDLKLIIDNPDNDTHILSINTKELNLNIELGKKLLNIYFKINSEEIKINLTANFNMEPIKEVTKKEITNTIKLEDLKDDDINTITENMGANNSLNNLITHIAGIEARNEV